MKRYVGLDLGTTTCGIAITDSTNTLVFPKCTLKYKNGNYEMLTHLLKSVLTDYDIEKIVIGLPINMDGTKGFACQRTLDFIPYLEKEGYIVATYDERLTTVASQKILHECNIKEKDFKGKIDMASAVMILESYLKWQENEK